MELKDRVPQRVKNWYHLGQAIVARALYGGVGRNVKVIGVTGTNGKTTTVRLIAEVLEAAGYRVARASTIDFKIGDKEWVNTTKYTNLPVFAVQKFLRRATRAKCDYVVFETSSHALDQHRVWGVPYALAVITNVTREHLDYHKTMRGYRQAKRRLFERAAEGIVNADMEDPEEFRCTRQKRCLTYSTHDPQANVLAESIETTMEGSKFTVDGERFELHLPGTFNLENALAAIAVGVHEGISLPVIARGIAKVTGVPGRMERIENHRGLTILVDYAVTPDSLEKLYQLVRQMKAAASNRIIAVFGSCGERDRGKRPIMGEIVSGAADVVILTNEDPYREDPMRIIHEIAAGVRGKRVGVDYFKILDRRKAIQKALSLARPGDIIVVTGKGAEEVMAIGVKRIPWNDRRVIEELLEMR